MVILDGRRTWALLVTGCGRTLVRSAKGAETGEQLTFKCKHGDLWTYPRKIIRITIEGHKYWCRTGVVPNLDTPLLIGRDCPILTRLVERQGQATPTEGSTPTLEGQDVGTQDPPSSDPKSPNSQHRIP